MRIDYRPKEELEGLWAREWAKKEIPESDRAVALEHSEEWRIIRPYRNEISPKRIADVGCGMGAWTLFVHQRGFETVGIDQESATISRLRDRFPDLRWMAYDVFADLLPDYEHFGAILSYGVYEHCRSGLGWPLYNSHYALAPGGYLCFSVPFENWRVRRQPQAAGQDGEFYQYRFTPEEVRRSVVAEGFAVREQRPIGKRQGVKRFVLNNLGLRTNLALQKLVGGILYPLLPKRHFAHMLFTVAVKSSSRDAREYAKSRDEYLRLSRSPR